MDETSDRSGARTGSEETAIEELRGLLRGRVLRPGEEGYDGARVVFNRMIDRRPRLIAQCAGVADVIAAVSFARRHRLLVAVRGGGHHVTGNAVCDDGIVIDLSPMKGLRIDPAARTARVEPGVNWGELNHDLQAFGLGATGGYVSITGIPGLTLGGGFGWLVRKHGLALDNLLSADMVTVDGQLVTASDYENQDLFWGLRGAGPNFGVVTSFEFRVHPVGTVVAGPLVYPLARAKEVLQAARHLLDDPPDELTWGVLLFTAPELPRFPAELHNAPLLGITTCWAGSADGARACLQPLRSIAPPLLDLAQPMPFSAAQTSADFLWPPGLRGYWKSSFLPALSDGVIDTMLEHFARVPSRRTVIVINHIKGGALSRVGAEETAFGNRGWPYDFLITSDWAEAADDEVNVTWTRDLYAHLEPHLAEAVYVNYTGDLGEDVLNRAYGAAARERLLALKEKYDPTNVLCLNHNIRPRSERTAAKRGGDRAEAEQGA